jgi:hypothetical protein
MELSISNMGEIIEFNTVLKLKKENLENLILGESRKFLKQGKRIFPLDIPLFLVDEDWHFHGIAQIENYQSFGGSTKGNYTPIRKFNESEEKVLFNLYRDLREIYDF